MSNKRPKVGLVLGSGGFRGLAHIGVLKVLHQNSIPLDFIAGTSIGALFGGVYAATKDISKIESIIHRTGWLKGFFTLLDPAIFPHRGFLDGRGLEDFIYSLVQDKNFSDTLIPFKCVACDLETGKEIVLDQGQLIFALRASMSAPFWFKPVSYRGHLLIDGDLVNPLPVNLAKNENCNLIIASSLTDQLVLSSTSWRGIPKLTNFWQKIFKEKYYWKRHKYTLFNLVARTNNILRQKLTQISLAQVDIKISPQISIRSVQWSKIYNARHNLDRFIKIGEEATKKVLPEIKRLISGSKHIITRNM